MKLYSLYTPDYAPLKEDWFLPSFQEDYELKIELVNKNQSWLKTILQKIEIIIGAIKADPGGSFVWSDIDVQFFKPTKEIVLKKLESLDIVLQQFDPRGQLCTGFFACRCNSKTLQLWEGIKTYCLTRGGRHDQHGLNYFIRPEYNPFNITGDYLPQSFFSPGPLNGRRGWYWEPGEVLCLPKKILLHHANWSQPNYPCGIKNKISQLQYVKANKNQD